MGTATPQTIFVGHPGWDGKTAHMPRTMTPDLPEFEVSAQIHVTAWHGPSEVSCKGCGLLRLPMYVKVIPGEGLANWVCFRCWSVAIVTWSPAT